MRMKDLLGLGPADGRITIPVRVWLPLMVVAVVVAVVVLKVIGRPSGLTSFLVVAVTLGLVLPVATLITMRSGSRSR
jgi:hypothetical protein